MKKHRKALALLLTAVLVLATLSACKSTPPSTPPSGSGSGSYTDYSSGFPEKVTIEIPVYDRAFEGWNVTDNFYTRWIQKEFGDKYNVEVKYVAIGRSTEVADFMSLLGAKTAPDIIFHYDMPQAVNYYNESAMQALDLDEIAYYAPDYWTKMGQTIKDYGKMDGKTYFFFAEREAVYYDYVTLIRQDWLDAVDAEIPTTREELVEVARKWKEKGLGTIGELFLNKSFTFYNGYIGSSVDAKEFAKYSDLSVAPLTWAPVKNFLKQRNSEYNAGILDPEFYLRDDDAKWKAEFVSGKIGTYAFYLRSSTDVLSSLTANDPNATVAVLPPSANALAGNNPYYYEYPPYGMIMGINSQSTDKERAAVYMLIEWMSKPDNLFYLQNGVEGQNYTKDANGVAIPVADFAGESKRSNNNNKDYWCLAAEVAHYATEELSFQANRLNFAPAGYEELVDKAYADWQAISQHGLINAIFTKPVASSADKAGDLNALWQTLYVDLVTCKESEFEAKYEAACTQYLNAGYQSILDEKQGLIDEGAYK